MAMAQMECAVLIVTVGEIPGELVKKVGDRLWRNSANVWLLQDLAQRNCEASNSALEDICGSVHLPHIFSRVPCEHY